MISRYGTFTLTRPAQPKTTQQPKTGTLPASTEASHQPVHFGINRRQLFIWGGATAIYGTAVSTGSHPRSSGAALLLSLFGGVLPEWAILKMTYPSTGLDQDDVERRTCAGLNATSLRIPAARSNNFIIHAAFLPGETTLGPKKQEILCYMGGADGQLYDRDREALMWLQHLGYDVLVCQAATKDQHGHPITDSIQSGYFEDALRDDAIQVVNMIRKTGLTKDGRPDGPLIVPPKPDLKDIVLVGRSNGGQLWMQAAAHINRLAKLRGSSERIEKVVAINTPSDYGLALHNIAGSEADPVSAWLAYQGIPMAEWSGFILGLLALYRVLRRKYAERTESPDLSRELRYEARQMPRRTVLRLSAALGMVAGTLQLTPNGVERASSQLIKDPETLSSLQQYFHETRRFDIRDLTPQAAQDGLKILWIQGQRDTLVGDTAYQLFQATQASLPRWNKGNVRYRPVAGAAHENTLKSPGIDTALSVQDFPFNPNTRVGGITHDIDDFVSH